jgi:hypothetical protein
MVRRPKLAQLWRKIKVQYGAWDPAMTLATILFVCFSFVAAARPLSPAVGQSATQPASAGASANTPATQDQTGAPPSPAQAPTDKKSPLTAAPRKSARKKTGNCGTLPASSGTAPSEGSMSPGATTPPAPCPPKKVIVRQGGTAEPSVRLGGGTSGDQAAHQRDVKQLLASTDENLKKLTGKKLTAGQQETVTQIHQFMDQSKAADTSGDHERARTLAWKAQLLSEELVKPKE